MTRRTRQSLKNEINNEQSNNTNSSDSTSIEEQQQPEEITNKRPKRNTNNTNKQLKPLPSILEWHGPTYYAYTTEQAEKYTEMLIDELCSYSEQISKYFNRSYKPYNKTTICGLTDITTCLQCNNIVDNYNDCCITIPYRTLPHMCIGFDIEWKIQWQKNASPYPVSLLQLSTGHNTYLYQLIHIQQSIPTDLIRLLECSLIGKVGININGDIRMLDRDYNIRVKNAVELSYMYNTLLPIGYTRRWNLNDICHSIYNVELLKDKKIRMGNWERCPLNNEQILYAATDSLAGYICYLHLYHTYVKHANNNNNNNLLTEQETIDYTDITQYTVNNTIKPIHLSVIQEETMKLFNQHNKTLEQIQHILGPSQSTIDSYIITAINGGHSYKWHNFRIKDNILHSIKQCIESLCKIKIDINNSYNNNSNDSSDD